MFHPLNRRGGPGYRLHVSRQQEQAMKIRRLETYLRGQLSVVRVEADDGAEGFGQIAPSNADISTTVLHRQVAPHALGADPLDIEGLSDRVVEANYKFPGSYVRRALGGLDSALWDLRGRVEGKGVCELWRGEVAGARPQSIAAYGSSMRRDIGPQAEAERMARLRDERGFGAFKLKIGRRRGRDADEWPGRTEAVVAAVRGRLGDGVRILVDANSCYTPAGAIAAGRMLEGFGVCHFEEPCPYWQYEWTAEVAAALDVPVAGGEQDCFLHNWRRMIDMRAVDIAQPDLLYVGGPTRALRVAAMAAAAGMPCTPHCANDSMLRVFTLHFLAAVPNAGPYVECSIEPPAWDESPYQPVPRVVAGRLAVPQGPGWGVTVRPDWLAAAERQVSEA